MSLAAIFCTVASIFLLTKFGYLWLADFQGRTYLNWTDILDSSRRTLAQRAVRFVPFYLGSSDAFTWRHLHFIVLLLGVLGLFHARTRLPALIYVVSVAEISVLLLLAKIDFNIRYLFVGYFFCLVAACGVIPPLLSRLAVLFRSTPAALSSSRRPASSSFRYCRTFVLQ